VIEKESGVALDGFFLLPVVLELIFSPHSIIVVKKKE